MAYLYVPESVCSTSGSSFCLETVSESSVTWSEKPMPRRRWSREWAKGGWIRLLSGMTCLHFAAMSYVAEWDELTWSMEESPANLTPQPVSDGEPPTNGTSGLAVSGRQHEHLQQSLRWLSEHQGSSDGVALTNGSGRGSSVGELREGQPDLVGSSVGDAEGERQATTGSGAQPKLSRLADSGSIMVDTDENGRDQGTHGLRSRRDADIPASPTYPSDTEGWARVLAEMPALEPALCKLADGSAPWLAESRHQLRGLGNAVVPLTAAKALATLGGRMR